MFMMLSGDDLDPPIDQPLALTRMQAACLELVAQNLTSKKVGRALAIAPSTVDNHILAACRALGIKDRAEAARAWIALANRQKLPSEPEPLVDYPAAPQLNPTVDGAEGTASWWRTWLPPVGGKTNELGKAARLKAMGRIGLLGAITFIAIILVFKYGFYVLR